MKKLLITTLCLLLHCTIVSNAQISPQLYKALPDSLKPADSKHLHYQEMATLLANIRYDMSLMLTHKQELGLLAGKLVGKSRLADGPKKDRVKYLHAAIKYYRDAVSPDVGLVLKLCRELLDIVKDDHSFDATKMDIYSEMGFHYSLIDDYEQSINYYDSAAALMTKAHDTRGLANIHVGKAGIYSALDLPGNAVTELEAGYNLMKGRKENNAENYARYAWFKIDYLLQQYRKDTLKDKNVLRLASQLADSALIRTGAVKHLWYAVFLRSKAAIAYEGGAYKMAANYVDSSLLPQYATRDVFPPDMPRIMLVKGLALAKLGAGPQAEKIFLDYLIHDSTGKYTVSRTYRLLPLAIYEWLYEYAKEKKDYKAASEYLENYLAYNNSISLIKQQGHFFEANQKYNVAKKNLAISRLQQEKNNIAFAGLYCSCYP